jgi:hypothetical protein
MARILSKVIWLMRVKTGSELGSVVPEPRAQPESSFAEDDVKLKHLVVCSLAQSRRDSWTS